MTKRLFKSLSLITFIVLGAISCSPKEPIVEELTTIRCTTERAESITENSAIITGSAIITNAKAKTASTCFYYSTEPGDYQYLLKGGVKVNANTIASDGGAFSSSLNGLLPETTYYYVAVVSIDNTESSGAVSSFTTQPKPKEPIVTGDVSSITATSAIIFGYTYPKETAGAEFGILFSKDNDPTWENETKVISSELDGDNKFTVFLSNLSPNTTYYYMSYLNEQGNLTFGSIKSFTTQDVEATVVTVGVSEVTSRTAILNGRLDVNVNINNNAWFMVSPVAASLESIVSGGERIEANLNSDGIFTAELSSLEIEKTYYYVACAMVSDRVFYGEVKEFTTSDLEVTVITGDPTEIGSFSAVLHGSVVIEDDADLSVDVYVDFDVFSDGGHMEPVSLNSDGSFSRYFHNFTPNTTVLYRTCAVINGRYYYGEIKQFTTDDFTVTVTTLEATDIGLFSARLNGTVTLEANWQGINYRIQDVGFRYLVKSGWSSNPPPDYAKYLRNEYEYSQYPDNPAIIDEDGSFSCVLQDIDDDVEYAFLAYVRITMDTEKDGTFYIGDYCYGDVVFFKTSTFSPSLITGIATDIDITSATLNGSLSIPNNESLNAEVWFMYSSEETTSEGIMMHGGHSSDATVKRGDASLNEDGSFASTIGQLDFNKTYYYLTRARIWRDDPSHPGCYLLNETITGDLKNFTTKDHYLNVSAEATEIDEFSVTLNASVSTSYPRDVQYKYRRDVWFVYSPSFNDLERLLTGGISTDIQRHYPWNGAEDTGFCISVTDLDFGTKYYYVACAQIEDKIVYSPVYEFTTIDIPEEVDLGLSVKWRSWDLGSSSPLIHGDYYAWGETTPKDYFSYPNYKWGNGKEFGEYKLTKYCDLAGFGAVDNKFQLDSEDDAAITKLGNGWRMPTFNEENELREHCSFTAVTIKNVALFKVTSSVNGNHIYLADCHDYVQEGSSFRCNYWTSTLCPTIDSNQNCLCAYVLGFDKAQQYGGWYKLMNTVRRNIGQLIRPVR